MKKRSKAATKSAKARPRKALTPKGRSAPKALPHRGAAPARETEVARLTRERDEALEQQTATSEVLQAISSFPGDLEPVFAKMLEKAVRICSASFGNIYRWNSESGYLIATYNTPEAFAAERRKSPEWRPVPGTPVSRLIATRSVVHVADLTKEKAYTEKLDPVHVAGVELGGVRSALYPHSPDDALSFGTDGAIQI